MNRPGTDRRIMLFLLVVNGVFLGPVAGDSIAAQIDKEEKEFAYVARMASIDCNETSYLSDTSVGEIGISKVNLLIQQRDLRNIDAEYSGLLGEAALDISSALPLMNKVYVYLEAQDFGALPIAMFTQLLSQRAFASDLRRYEELSQDAAITLVQYLRDRSVAANAAEHFTCNISPSDVLLTNNSPQDLSNCLVSVIASDIFGQQIQIVAFVEQWSTLEGIRVWSGRRHSFGPVTDIEVEVLCFNQRFEKKVFTFSDRVMKACEFACREVEETFEKDKFDSAIEEVSSLRAILKRRSVTSFEERLDRVVELSTIGLSLVVERNEWLSLFVDNPKLQGEYRQGRDRAKVGCIVTHTDSETGDIRLKCYVVDGRNRSYFHAFGKVDIVPDEEKIVVSLRKQSRRSRSEVEELTLEKTGRSLIGRDSAGGRISFRPVRDRG